MSAVDALRAASFSFGLIRIFKSVLAHGFSIDMMVELVNAGLASATAERVVAGSRRSRSRGSRGRRALAGNC
jgi:hypothetical protein